MSNLRSRSTYPLTVQAIRVSQPLGIFYVAAIPARVLLDTAYSDRLRARRNADGTSYELEGSQRELLIPRLREIGRYISTEESTFPNSIILAPNFDRDSGRPIEDEKIRWKIEELDDPLSPDGKIYTLNTPSGTMITPIIDGQHRLFGFNYCERRERLDEQLVCSIFLDLPKPFQAFLFATINSNQKPVNKSQTYELFGYNIEKEPPESWSPDKLAVFLARKLNSESDSPLCGRILIAAENDFSTTRAEAKRIGEWTVSMAVIVEGICRLLSQNTKKDRIALLQLPVRERKRNSLGLDKAPLRSLYIDSNDKVIYAALKNYFTAVKKIFWDKSPPNSFIIKTVGIQALFDVLMELAKEGLVIKTFTQQFFEERLHKAININFSHQYFRNASGSGRKAIKTCLFIRLGLTSPDTLDNNEKDSIFDALNRRWN